MATDIKNFCKDLGLMYGCDKNEKVEEQEKCSYFEKSKHANRCIYLKFDEFCDCLDAILKKKEKEKK